MMSKLEEAIIYAAIMHQGRVRKLSGVPFILHPTEVAQILATMTDDEDIITAGILHDIVEDTDGTLVEIEKRFGKRAADLVLSRLGSSNPDEMRDAGWKQRKEEALLVMKNSQDIGVDMLWLADTLSNMRALAGAYSERGEELWKHLEPSDPVQHCWYYRSVAEQLELSLNKTGAFKELIKHINSVWPGTFDSGKARYKQYKEVSVEGCQLLGRGAKGEVYRYNDELVIKVYNRNNTYHDVEQEIALSRKAFILGIPTAISFGIVSVGERYGAMYELVDSATISKHIARHPAKVETYAKLTAELAHTIHGISVSADDGFPAASDRLRNYIDTGLALENEALAEKCRKLIDSLPASDTLIHGDFHTGNVFLQHGEPLLIDMDRLSVGHPLVELSNLCYYYSVLGEDNPAVVEDFMGFSYQTARQFFHFFLTHYLQTEDENRLREVAEKASLLCYVRMIHRLRKKELLSEEDRKAVDRCLEKVAALTESLDTLAI